MRANAKRANVQICAGERFRCLNCSAYIVHHSLPTYEREGCEDAPMFDCKSCGSEYAIRESDGFEALAEIVTRQRERGYRGARDFGGLSVVADGSAVDTAPDCIREYLDAVERLDAAKQAVEDAAGVVLDAMTVRTAGVWLDATGRTVSPATLHRQSVAARERMTIERDQDIPF